MKSSKYKSYDDPSLFLNVNGGPGETQGRGFAWERKNGGMSETCRLRRGGGYEARSDDKQEKAPPLRDFR